MSKQAITVGSKVRLTGKHLRSTGQTNGEDRWVVTGFDRNGEWAIINEPIDASYFTDEELKADPTLAFRRIAVGNLEVCAR